MDKFVIIGLGVFGRALAENLAQKGTEVIAVDRNMELVEEIRTWLLIRCVWTARMRKRLNLLV